MKVKASLHLHSSEDEEDGLGIKYTLFELIDRAEFLGFKVLASTCHNHCICRPEHIRYAKEKGILLIAGVEANVNGHRHILVLNGGEEANNLRTAAQFKDFKLRHPESFIIAPHPNHRAHSISLHDLRKLSDIIDAVEHSWYYTSNINPNLKAEQACQELKLPFIATSDAHIFNYLDADYAIIDVEELTPKAVFKSIRSGKFKNISRPKSLREMIGFIFFLIHVKIISIFD